MAWKRSRVRIPPGPPNFSKTYRLSSLSPTPNRVQTGSKAISHRLGSLSHTLVVAMVAVVSIPVLYSVSQYGEKRGPLYMQKLVPRLPWPPGCGIGTCFGRGGLIREPISERASNVLQ